jgi:hypothetical protein
MLLIGGTICLKCKKGTYHLNNLIILRKKTINDKSNKKLTYKCNYCGDIITRPYMINNRVLQTEFKDIE